MASNPETVLSCNNCGRAQPNLELGRCPYCGHGTENASLSGSDTPPPSPFRDGFLAEMEETPTTLAEYVKRVAALACLNAHRNGQQRATGSCNHDAATDYAADYTQSGFDDETVRAYAPIEQAEMSSLRQQLAAAEQTSLSREEELSAERWNSYRAGFLDANDAALVDELNALHGREQFIAYAEERARQYADRRANTDQQRRAARSGTPT